jgi:excisionase family DNA binding protein
MGSPRKRREDMTTGEVARYCKVSTKTVSTWTDACGLNHYRMPGGTRQDHRRIPQKDLIAFLRSKGMPVPAEIADEIFVTMGLEQKIDGWRSVTPFDLGSVVGAAQIGAALFGSGLTLWLIREAATLIRQHSPKAKIGLILDEDQAAVIASNDPAFNAGVYQQPCDVHAVAQAILIREVSAPQ